MHRRNGDLCRLETGRRREPESRTEKCTDFVMLSKNNIESTIDNDIQSGVSNNDVTHNLEFLDNFYIVLSSQNTLFSSISRLSLT